MTGRNHHRVGAGQIAEFANDWDGYAGSIPKSSATIAEVLGHYGYASAAFGKDHNTPVDQPPTVPTTARRPAAASTTSTVSSPARPPSGNPPYGRTPTRFPLPTSRTMRTST